jgi:hypothetical protein
MTQGFIMFILLTSPVIMSNFITNIRQGVALSIFLVGVTFANRMMKFIMILMSIFIHIGMSYLLVNYYLASIVNNLRVRLKLKIFLMVLGSLLASLLLQYLTLNERYLNIRQLKIEQEVHVGHLGVLLGLSLLSLLAFFHRNNLGSSRDENKIFLLLSISILSFYVFNYYYFYAAARIFIVGLPLVVISFSFLNNNARLIAYVLMITSQVFIWSRKLSIENLGF